MKHFTDMSASLGPIYAVG